MGLKSPTSIPIPFTRRGKVSPRSAQSAPIPETGKASFRLCGPLNHLALVSHTHVFFKDTMEKLTYHWGGGGGLGYRPRVPPTSPLET
jgi:hypothetical protein